MSYNWWTDRRLDRWKDRPTNRPTWSSLKSCDAIKRTSCFDRKGFRQGLQYHPNLQICVIQLSFIRVILSEIERLLSHGKQLIIQSQGMRWVEILRLYIPLLISKFDSRISSFSHFFTTRERRQVKTTAPFVLFIARDWTRTLASLRKERCLEPNCQHRLSWKMKSWLSRLTFGKLKS